MSRSSLFLKNQAFVIQNDNRKLNYVVRAYTYKIAIYFLYLRVINLQSKTIEA